MIDCPGSRPFNKNTKIDNYHGPGRTADIVLVALWPANILSDHRLHDTSIGYPHRSAPIVTNYTWRVTRVISFFLVSLYELNLLILLLNPRRVK